MDFHNKSVAIPFDFSASSLCIGQETKMSSKYMYVLIQIWPETIVACDPVVLPTLQSTSKNWPKSSNKSCAREKAEGCK